MSVGSFRSPFAAIVWKEWRESGWLLVLTFLAPTAWHVALQLFTSEDRPDLEMMAPIGLCLLGLSLGARLFAAERAEGTAVFEEERPVGRGLIWDAKFLLPIVSLAAAAGLFSLLAFSLWPPGGWRVRITVEPYLFIALALLCFASGTLCSALLDRPITAWAAGGVLCIAAFMGEGYLFDRVLGLWGKSNDWRWLLFLGLLLFTAIVLLWLSRVAYIRWSRN